jgi:hypothetical protein
MAEQNSIPTNTDIIIGLPNETAESFKSSLFDAVSKGMVVTASYLSILPNSEMNNLDYRNKYGIKTKIVVDHQDKEKEFNEVVVETNTMSKQEMNDCYLYVWFMSQFHDTGYTTFFYNFCRHRYGWSLREFYEKLVPASFEDQEQYPNTWLGRYKNHIDDDLTGDLTINVSRSQKIHNLLGHDHRDDIFNGFGNIVKSFVPESDIDLIDDLTTLSNYYQINKKNEEFETFTINSNLYEHIVKNKELRLEQTTYSAKIPPIPDSMSFGEFILRAKWKKLWRAEINRLTDMTI